MNMTALGRIKNIVFPIILIQLLTACIPLAVGTATVTAVSLSKERRTLGKVIDDSTLELKLKGAYMKNDVLNDTHISIASLNGIVLLTGEVPSDQQRRLATDMAKQYPQTQEVVNEIELSGNTNLTSRANDSYITTKVKSKLLNNGFSLAVNIKVITERGKVYLMGILTREEADQAVQIIQSVTGVTQIVKIFEYVN